MPNEKDDFNARVASDEDFREAVVEQLRAAVSEREILQYAFLGGESGEPHSEVLNGFALRSPVAVAVDDVDTDGGAALQVDADIDIEVGFLVDRDFVGEFTSGAPYSELQEVEGTEMDALMSAERELRGRFNVWVTASGDLSDAEFLSAELRQDG